MNHYKNTLTLLLFLVSTLSYGQTTSDSLINARFNRIEKLLGVLRDFRVVSYIQTEWQLAQSAGASSYAGGNFPLHSDNRFMIRRGRLKMGYEHRNAKDIRVMEFAFQFDATERGFLIKELYGVLTDPWIGWFSLQGGIFRHQFGYETAEQPAFAVSPEIGRMNQTILPNDYDLGEKIIIESPDKFKPVHLRLDAGLVNGVGVGVGSQTGAYQSKKDFSGRLLVSKRFEAGKNVSINLTATGSLYYGGVLQTAKNVFAIEENTHDALVYTNIGDTANIYKKYYQRIYSGAHLQLDINYKAGSTMLRGEYISGRQPGTATSSVIPTGVGNAAPGVDLYLRNFNGAIFYVSQTIKHKIGKQQVSHDFTIKFDWYNPNSQIASKNLSTVNDAKVSGADVIYRTVGFGYVFHPADYVKLVIWYDLVKNPSTNITNYGSDLKDNVLTIRTQFYIDSWWFNKK